MVTQQQADSIREGLLQEATDRELAHQYRTLTATQFFQGYLQGLLDDEVALLCTQIDNGLDSLAITPK